MAGSEQLCGRWTFKGSEIFDGEVLIGKGARWRVASCPLNKRELGKIAVKLEVDEAQGEVGIVMIPIDDLERP